MDLEQLAQAMNFDNPHTTGKIKYDVEKLRWVNHQWITKLSPAALAQAVMPFLANAYPQASSTQPQELANILQIIKTDLYTLADAVTSLEFYFTTPHVTKAAVQACVSDEYMQPLISLINAHKDAIDNPQAFLQALKSGAKANNIPLKQLFWFLRLALMGQVNGPSIHDLIEILGPEASKTRIESLISTLS